MTTLVDVAAGIVAVVAMAFAARGKQGMIVWRAAIAATYLATAVTAAVMGPRTPAWLMSILVGGGLGIGYSLIRQLLSRRRSKV